MGQQISSFIISKDSFGNDTAPVSIESDQDGTNRLAVTYGIPFLNILSNYVTFRATLSGTSGTIYTTPTGKTFYLFNMIITNTDANTQTINFYFNSTSPASGTQLPLRLLAGQTISIPCTFPFAIIEGGKLIDWNASGTNNIQIYFTGYEQFGVTR